MGKKQTATQWLAEQMDTAKWKFADITDRNAIIQQAIQMEKEQIITSHHDGYNDGCLKNNASSAKYYYDNY
jgi:hypothetical protein